MINRALNRPSGATCAMALLALAGLATPGAACADDAAAGTVVPPAADGYFSDWFARVDRTQAEQPHWMTPLVTVTPRLEEELRYDQYWEQLPNGAELDSFGGGKGLELIPTERTELILGAPPYQIRGGKEPASGFGDWPFLLVKYRLVSASEADGNYIVTAFLQGSAPVGIATYSTNEYAVTPTLAFGKGWGNFDLQATLGVSFPTGAVDKIGDAATSNVALQYHVAEYFWPELEVSTTWWANGPREGKTQVLLTPGIVFGRFPIYDRLKLSIGVGYQFAVSPATRLSPPTPTYKNNAILSVRFAF